MASIVEMYKKRNTLKIYCIPETRFDRVPRSSEPRALPLHILPVKMNTYRC